jgi:hypothetical protein
MAPKLQVEKIRAGLKWFKVFSEVDLHPLDRIGNIVGEGRD